VLSLVVPACHVGQSDPGVPIRGFPQALLPLVVRG
jgi:hypothetical protein